MLPEKAIEWEGSTWELLDVREMLQKGDMYVNVLGECQTTVHAGTSVRFNNMPYYRKKKLEQGGIVASKTYAVNPDRVSSKISIEPKGKKNMTKDTPELDIDIHRLFGDESSEPQIDISQGTGAGGKKDSVRSSDEIENRIDDLNEMISEYGQEMSSVRLREIVTEIRTLEWVLMEFEC